VRTAIGVKAEEPRLGHPYRGGPGPAAALPHGTCGTCGKPVTETPVFFGPAVFCGLECGKAAMGRQVAGNYLG
jgi:hypothetical protein